MKKPPIAATLLLLAAGLHADTIRLSDGRELEGEILREDGDEYVVRVQVTATIRDERRIPKDQVVEIIEEKMDEAAFEAIASLTPTPDLLEVADYEQRIRQVEKFIEGHPDSPLIEQAEEVLKTLDEEVAIIRQGGLKFDGEMIEAEERARHAYAIDARIARRRVERLARAGNLVEALRAWERFSTDFRGSEAFTDSLPFARRLVGSQLARVSESLETFDQRVAERKAGLERIPPRDRDRTERILAEESAEYLARVQREKAAGVRWPSLDPYHKEPLETTREQLEDEQAKLNTLDPAKLPDTQQAWDEAWETLDNEPTPEAAREALEEAGRAGLPEDYLKQLEALAPEAP